MKLTICDDGYVAEIKSDEDFELFLQMITNTEPDDFDDSCGDYADNYDFLDDWGLLLPEDDEYELNEDDTY